MLAILKNFANNKQKNHPIITMNNDIPPPPEPPEDYECCNNGCDDLCVFEIYKLQKADYDTKYATQTTSDDKPFLKP